MVGVPEIIIVLVAHCAEIPEGNPFAPETPLFAIPVAPVVVWVTAVIALLTQTVGEEDAAETVLLELTVIVPFAVTEPQPPVNVTV